MEVHTYHPASETEQMTLLSPLVVNHSIMLMQQVGIEPTFMVCDQTNTVEHGYVTDTRTGYSFSFEVLSNTPEEFDILPTSDWTKREAS